MRPASTGGSPKRIVVTPPDATDSLPRYSPDGKQIAFVRQTVDENFEPSSTLELVPAAGGTPTPLVTGVTSTLAEGGALTFSPDGKLIAFAGDLGNPGIFTVPVAGGDAAQLTFDGDYWPSFAADGKSILFARDSTSSGAVATAEDDIYELWSVGADGSDETLVAQGDFEYIVTPPAPRSTASSGSGSGSSGSGSSGSGTSGSGGSTEPVAGKTATSVLVVKKGSRYVVSWKGKASSWAVTLKVGKKKAAATVAGNLHVRAFTLRGAKGTISATVKGS
jgi:dipeptidyl aminopeptidase/acylaminoacyl peptidase